MSRITVASQRSPVKFIMKSTCCFHHVECALRETWNYSSKQKLIVEDVYTDSVSDNGPSGKDRCEENANTEI